MTYSVNVDLALHVCGECGVVFAVSKGYQKQLMESGDTFHCPEGHSLHFVTPTPEPQDTTPRIEIPDLGDRFRLNGFGGPHPPEN